MDQVFPCSEMSTEDLRRMIENAFRATPKPVGQLTSYGSKTVDTQAMEDLFDHRHWSSFTADELVPFKDHHAFFTAEALRYYIPAYLLVSLEPGEAADEIENFVTIAIMLADEDAYWRTKMSVFSEEERAAIRAYANRKELFDDFGDSLEKALHGFWAEK